MHSLRFKITAITVVAILTAVFLVFLVSFATVQAQSDQDSVEMMNLLGQDTAKSVEKYTEDIEQSVDMIANVASDTLDSVALVKGGAAGSAARQASRTPQQAAQLDAYLAEHCATIQRVSATMADHAHGAVGYFYCISPDVSETQHGFFYSNAGKTGFIEREPLDARELDPADTDYYFYALGKDGVHHFSKTYNEHVNFVNSSQYVGN